MVEMISDWLDYMWPDFFIVFIVLLLLSVLTARR